jgi:hypothetical protein
MVGTLSRCGLLLAAWHSRGLQRRYLGGPVCEPRYVPCDSAVPEGGYEKLAIYGEQDEWEHATRQVDGSVWTSKLGADDISHDEHDLLGGPKYATIVKIMRRPTAG